MSNSPVILLDMDGVCVNFLGGIGRLLIQKGKVDEVLTDYTKWPRGVYDATVVYQIDPVEMWQCIDSTRAFWLNLDPYPWFNVLYSSLRRIARVVFCSTPSYSADSVDQKLRWLQCRFGNNFRDYVFTPHKALLAKEGAVLIDDCDFNVDVFNESGGRGFVFPMLHNSLHESYDQHGGMIHDVLFQVRTAIGS